MRVCGRMPVRACVRETKYLLNVIMTTNTTTTTTLTTFTTLTTLMTRTTLTSCCVCLYLGRLCVLTLRRAMCAASRAARISKVFSRFIKSTERFLKNAVDS